MRHAPISTFADASPLGSRRTTAERARPIARFGVAAAGLFWLLGLPGRVAAIRRDMALLGRMNSAELADIGLSRQDVWDAAALPLGHAPGPLLTERAEQRRRAARARRR